VLSALVLPIVSRKQSRNGSTWHNVSVPSSNEPRSQRAILAVCNNQPCIAASKNSGNCWVMLVCCIQGSVPGCTWSCTGVSCSLESTLRLDRAFSRPKHPQCMPEVLFRVHVVSCQLLTLAHPAACCSICSIVTGVLVGVMGVARIVASMSRTHLFFPQFGKISDRFQTPMWATVFVTVAAVPLSLLSDLPQLIDMVSAGQWVACSACKPARASSSHTCFQRVHCAKATRASRCHCNLVV
jgi:hypothetical protein